MKKYELELSYKSFNDFEKELDKYIMKFKKIKEKILIELAKYTQDRIKFYIKSTVNEEYSTNKLYESILTSDVYNDTIRVYTDLAYAKYVEYGTGIVGASNPHPDADFEYSSEGWWYKTTAEDKNPRKKQLPNGDYIVYTEGQKAHKFMYNAFQDLKMNYIKIAMDVLRKEGLV